MHSACGVSSIIILFFSYVSTLLWKDLVGIYLLLDSDSKLGILPHLRLVSFSMSLNPSNNGLDIMTDWECGCISIYKIDLDS